jgi:hypothetical protein
MQKKKQLKGADKLSAQIPHTKTRKNLISAYVRKHLCYSQKNVIHAA